MAEVVLHHPKTVEEALELLDRYEDARCLAGGASLVAMVNARLLAPKRLVGLKAIAELCGITVADNGTIRIGAMTRHRETAREMRLGGELACLRAAAGSIANPPVRNMGTIGGSIALSDPGADYPPALVALRAEIEIASRAGRRRVGASDFFRDWYATALQAGEIATAIVLPAPQGGFAVYRKLNRVAGDFAIASVALSVTRAGTASIAVGGCGPVPVASGEANALLSNRLGDPQAARQAGELLARLADPMDDVRASADYRRLVIPRLVAEAAASISRRICEAT